MNDVAQLEFSLTNGRLHRGREFRHRRQTRAQWWFQRMRQVVDQAREWQQPPPPRPEQIWFPNTQRQIELPAPANEQRQICE